MTFLDHATTTPIHPAAAAAMATAPWADPIRLYGESRRARIALDQARASCAAAIGARPEEIIFTSGGTEANVLAVVGGVRAALAARRPPRVVVSAIEQTSILRTVAELAVEVVTLGVDGDGRVDPGAFADALAGGAALACIQVANGEIGTLQPVAELASIARTAKTWLLADATFATGWMPLDLGALGADLVAVSGHHTFGPPGTGFLVVRRGARVRPMQVGDDRERGVRAGMPNLPGLVGLAAALDARDRELRDDGPKMRALTSRLRDELPKAEPEVLVHGHPDERLPHIVSFTIPLVEGDALLLGLDERGFAVHSGSACVSTTAEPSHVLAAIGTLTHGAIRLSIGPSTTDADIDRFLDALSDVIAAARARLRR